ncbi:hypothetical protein EMCRGX_G000806 [Ephydatia muelleri]
MVASRAALQNSTSLMSVIQLSSITEPDIINVPNGPRFDLSEAPWVQHSSHSLECSQLLVTTRENLRTLICEALRLRLVQKRHLSPVGKKDVLVERLFQLLQESDPYVLGNIQPVPSRPTTTAGTTPSTSRVFPTPRASNPQRRPGDLSGVQPWQMQQSSRVLYFSQKRCVTGCGGDHSAKACPRAAPVAPSHNLSTAHAHPDVVDSELEKEITAGRIIDPFAELPLHKLRISGVGGFPVHYSSVDDVVALLSQYGLDALIAKIDLKAAFRLIPPLLSSLCQGTQLANKYGAQLLHYLDDFLLVGLGKTARETSRPHAVAPNPSQHSFTIRLSHLPGRLNSIADALSQNNLPLFFTLAPQADPQPTPIPCHLTETSTTISSCN